MKRSSDIIRSIIMLHDRKGVVLLSPNCRYYKSIVFHSQWWIGKWSFSFKIPWIWNCYTTPYYSSIELKDLVGQYDGIYDKRYCSVHKVTLITENGGERVKMKLTNESRIAEVNRDNSLAVVSDGTDVATMVDSGDLSIRSYWIQVCLWRRAKAPDRKYLIVQD